MFHKRHVLTRDGKEMLEFGSVWVLPHIRVRSLRVLSSYGKMKVRFGFSSLCRVFGSVWFGQSLWFCMVRFYVGFQMNI